MAESTKKDEYIGKLVEDSKSVIRQEGQEFAGAVRADLDSFKKKALSGGNS